VTTRRLAAFAVASSLPFLATFAADAPPRRAAPPAAWVATLGPARAGAQPGDGGAPVAVPVPAPVVAFPAALPAPAPDVVPVAARAGGPTPVLRSVPAVATPSEVPEPQPPARVKKTLDEVEVELHGEFFLDGFADQRSGWSRDVSVGRARFEADARAGALRTVIEADVVDSRKLLKDAYARLDGDGMRLVAGRFKAPFLERELVSAWKLPTVSRGLVQEYLVSRNELGGRRVGAVGVLRPWDGVLDVSLGVFQGTATTGTRVPQDYVARAAVRATTWLTVGASGYSAGRTADATGPARRAADAFLRVDAGPLTASAEALTGRVDQGPFRAGIALVQYAVKLAPGTHLAPLAGAEALQLSGARTGAGAVLGAVLSYGRDLKVKVQGERARRPGDAAPANAVAVELATRF
jgi:hypothetical protein